MTEQLERSLSARKTEIKDIKDPHEKFKAYLKFLKETRADGTLVHVNEEEITHDDAVLWYDLVHIIFRVSEGKISDLNAQELIDKLKNVRDFFDKKEVTAFSSWIGNRLNLKNFIEVDMEAHNYSESIDCAKDDDNELMLSEFFGG